MGSDVLLKGCYCRRGWGRPPGFMDHRVDEDATPTRSSKDLGNTTKNNARTVYRVRPQSNFRYLCAFSNTRVGRCS
jgi:hypothetical protein